MGFIRKATFVATGGISGLAFKANSKKERTANAAERQVEILDRLTREQADSGEWIEVEEESGVFHLSLSQEIENLADLRDQGVITESEFVEFKGRLGAGGK